MSARFSLISIDPRVCHVQACLDYAASLAEEQVTPLEQPAGLQ